MFIMSSASSFLASLMLPPNSPILLNGFYPVSWIQNLLTEHSHHPNELVFLNPRDLATSKSIPSFLGNHFMEFNKLGVSKRISETEG